MRYGGMGRNGTVRGAACAVCACRVPGTAHQLDSVSRSQSQRAGQRGRVAPATNGQRRRQRRDPDPRLNLNRFRYRRGRGRRGAGGARVRRGCTFRMVFRLLCRENANSTKYTCTPLPLCSGRAHKRDPVRLTDDYSHTLRAPPGVLSVADPIGQTSHPSAVCPSLITAHLCHVAIRARSPPRRA